MTRLGLLSRLLLVVVIGCNVVLSTPAQSPGSPNVSDLDKVMNQAGGSGPYAPPYVNARGKVKEISKKAITIVQPDGQELTFRLDHVTNIADGRTARKLKTIKLTDIAAGDGVLVRFTKRADPHPHRDLAVFVVRVSTS
jgi:hypothetical protein